MILIASFLCLLATVEAKNVYHVDDPDFEFFMTEFTNITVTRDFKFGWGEVATSFKDGTPWQYELIGFCYFLNQDISDWEYNDRMDCSIGIVDSPLTDWQII